MWGWMSGFRELGLLCLPEMREESRIPSDPHTSTDCADEIGLRIAELEEGSGSERIKAGDKATV